MGPQMIGPFEILSELGRGGFATVYRAQDSRDGREVALKVLRSREGGPGLDEIRRFRREVEAASLLDHPGIVKVFDVSSEGIEPAWVALELIEGESLTARIAREPLPWREAVEIARDVADAVAHAHGRGILHRDLKPGNILLGHDGRPQVVDFGLAKLATHGSKLTTTGQALGTPAYMSPEQARGEVSSLTPATDVWSLGCVLYEMLAGHPPFEGETDAAVVGRVLLAGPPKLRTLRGDVPEGVERVVWVCLGKRVRDRYPDAVKLRDDLDRVLRGERPKARLRWHWEWKAAAAALLGGAAAWGGVAAWPHEGAPAPVPVAPVPSAVEALVAKAKTLRQTDPRRAAEILREALNQDPARGDLRIERGLLLWAVGENAGAREEWGRVPSGSSEQPWARLFLGLEAFFRLEGEEARPHLLAVREARGRVGSLVRGAILALEKDWLRAREALAGVEGWEAHLLRGYIESSDSAGDGTVSIREYGSALDSGISFAWAWNNRGVERGDLGDHAGAVADYDRALKVDPRHAGAWHNRGGAKHDLGDLAGAVADYDRALELDPRLAQAWNSRGLAKQSLGDHAGAVADFDRALELDSRYAKVWNNRGTVKQSAGDHAGAVADYDRALELDSRYTNAWYNRSTAKRCLGDLAGAAADLDHALDLDPRLAPAWNSRGVLKWALGDHAGAVLDYDRALELDTRYAEALSNRGAARWNLGDLAGAVADCEKALDVAPPDWPQRAVIEQRLAEARARVAPGDGK
ncbi:MAG: serine/threonine-protein kinase [Planctomycetales bacterium]|nr:serine/threonine-protein kinase [Planctomycetales bacterium]